MYVTIGSGRSFVFAAFMKFGLMYNFSCLFCVIVTYFINILQLNTYKKSYIPALRPFRQGWLYKVSLTETVWVEQHVNASVFLLETDSFAIFESAIEGEPLLLDVTNMTSRIDRCQMSDTVRRSY